MRNRNKAHQRQVNKVMQKQAQYEREIYSNKRELPRIRHANHTIQSLFNQWANLSLSQQFMIFLVLSTVIYPFPMVSASHEYNLAAPVQKNPYAVVPQSFLSQLYTELSNFFSSSQGDDISTFTSINECHYLVPLSSTSNGQEERTVMCVQNLVMPNIRNFKDAERSALEFMRVGKKINYLAVLYAWPKTERLKLIKSVDKQIAKSHFPNAENKLFDILPREGLYDHPYQMAILSDWVQISGSNLLLFYQFSQDKLALAFNLLKTDTAVGYQWLQAFMVYCLAENNEHAALSRIEAFIRRGITAPQLMAENAIVTNAINSIRKMDATPLSPEDELSMAKMSNEINDQRLPLLTTEERQHALLMLTYSSLFTHACDLGKFHIVEFFLREPELTGLTADDVAMCLALARLNKSAVLNSLSQALQDPKIARLKNAKGKTITEIDTANNERLTQYEVQLNSRRSLFAGKQYSNQQISPSRASSSVFYHRLDQDNAHVLGQSSEKVVILRNENQRKANVR